MLLKQTTNDILQKRIEETTDLGQPFADLREEGNTFINQVTNLVDS